MKLREELLQVSTDNPSMDELNGLPYLDMVIKETLRHHSPVPMTLRMAMQDDMIPVDSPFTDKQGRVRDYIECVYLLPICLSMLIADGRIGSRKGTW